MGVGRCGRNLRQEVGAVDEKEAGKPPAQAPRARCRQSLESMMARQCRATGGRVLVTGRGGQWATGKPGGSTWCSRAGRREQQVRTGEKGPALAGA